jgi:hypothetical protein
MDGVAIAEKILELDENEDYAAILNLGTANENDRISSKSSTPPPFALLRKLYLKLSLAIHPDKIGKSFPQATRAFQALVKAFEYLSNPPTIEADEGPASRRGGTRSGASEQNPLQISRSNENCYRTRVCCPRCKQPWSENSLDGNPDYCYNLLMMGLKQFTCSTCLCEFGCMTAIHCCPFCKKKFEYHPRHYHEQIACSSCSKTFGFYLYHISDRTMKEIKASIKEDLLQKQKLREDKRRRAERSAKRGHGVLSQAEKEKAFSMGLADICPRCGEDLSDFEDEEECRNHLMNCTDDNKHKTFQKAQKKKEQKEQRKEHKKQKQDEVETLAGWQFFGGQSSQLWLLNEEQVKEEAKKKGLSIKGDKDDVIERLIEFEQEEEGDGDGTTRRSDRKRLRNRAEEEKEEDDENDKDKKELDELFGDDNDNEEDDDYEDKKKKKNKKQKMSSSLALVPVSHKNEVVLAKKKPQKPKVINVDMLPSNLYSLSVNQLRSLCVSNGLKSLIPKNAKKSDLLDLLEEEIYE